MKNEISDSAHIIGEVKMGSGNFVSNGATIIGPISIGDNNFFGPNCVVGTPPQDDLFGLKSHKAAALGQSSEFFGVEIGSRNIIREFVTIHKGLTSPTTIKDDCYLMSYAHIAHDCSISSQVKIANTVQMGGYTSILDGAYVGLSAVIHQFSVIGHYSMVGMGSIVTRNVPPAGLAVGSPARTLKINEIAVRKLGITEIDWAQIYLSKPSIDSVHPNLVRNFEEFEIVKSDRASQRKVISEWRNQKR